MSLVNVTDLKVRVNVKCQDPTKFTQTMLGISFSNSFNTLEFYQ